MGIFDVCNERETEVFSMLVKHGAYAAFEEAVCSQVV